MRLSIELAPEAGQLKHIRRLVSDWADAVQADPDSLPLIATELVTNAIAVNPPSEPVVVWLDREGDEAHLSVMDGGAGLERSDTFAPPPATATRGRGLAIVDGLADRLEIYRADGCTVITACTRLDF
jgi:anti-sigma regulatory factor (Ser/Thr protein kinase)